MPKEWTLSQPAATRLYRRWFEHWNPQHLASRFASAVQFAAPQDLRRPARIEHFSFLFDASNKFSFFFFNQPIRVTKRVRQADHKWMGPECALTFTVSKTQWKPFWLATQLCYDPQNDWVGVAISCELWRTCTGQNVCKLALLARVMRKNTCTRCTISVTFREKVKIVRLQKWRTLKKIFFSAQLLIYVCTTRLNKPQHLKFTSLPRISFMQVLPW